MISFSKWLYMEKGMSYKQYRVRSCRAQEEIRSEYDNYVQIVKREQTHDLLVSCGIFPVEDMDMDSL